MELLTRYDLASKSDGELRGLYCKTFNALIQSALESPERRNALASLENLTRGINQRYSDLWRRDAGL